MILLDGQPQDNFPNDIRTSIDAVMAQLSRICEPIPDSVELGFHLCYGDFGAKHFIEPIDAARMVEVANAMAQAISHRIAFIHMPVPIDRTDDAFFRPLAELKLDPTTEIYLGLVHVKDGAEGTMRRLQVARKYLPEFGIATECGIARARKPELIAQILAVHVDVSREPPASQSPVGADAR
jgi:methionine synthase II (cobalamin-independent)